MWRTIVSEAAGLNINHRQVGWMYLYPYIEIIDWDCSGL